MDEHSSIKHRVAWTVVAEIGPDVLSFPSPAHIASWVGVCPGNHESAGQRAKASAV
jgi:transposase